MGTRKPNVRKIESEMAALSARKQALQALEDTATLNDLMISLCEDPAKVEAYKLDPSEFLRRAGLPEHLVELVISSSRYAFRAAAAPYHWKPATDKRSAGWLSCNPA